jgi:hypothetical protein
MRWRVTLAITIATSWLVYSLLPLTSDLLRFALAGLAFGLLSRTLPVAINSIVAAQTLIAFRLIPSVSRAIAIEEARTESVDRKATTTSTETSIEVQRNSLKNEPNR